jgi:ribosome-associated protein
MIQITKDIVISDNEIQEDFVRASGPGGQKVNKVSTAVQLRFNVVKSPSLPEPVRKRLMRLAGHQITEEGFLLIEAKRFRTQEQNRQDARQRLVSLIRQAAQRPKVRRPTKPPPTAQKRRLNNKRQRSKIKRLRQSPDIDD